MTSKANIWASDAQASELPVFNQGSVFRSSNSIWTALISLIKKSVLDDVKIDLEGHFVRELSSHCGSVNIAFDDESGFVSLLREQFFIHPEDHGISHTSLEVFLCPQKDDQCIVGYRIKNQGDPIPMLKIWPLAWLEFCIAHEANATDVDWHLIPNHVMRCSTWSARGNINIDLANLRRLQREKESLEQDLAVHQDQIFELNKTAETLKGDLIHWKSLAAEVHGWNVPDSVHPAIPEDEPDQPWTDFSLIEEWSSKNSDRIIILPRALNEAKKSDYVNPEHVHLGLEFLAGAYREGRIGNLSLAEVEESLAASGTKLAGSVGASIAGYFGDSYYVSWSGRRRFMDLHLTRGGGRATRFCMRIYFFWSEEDKKVVVGWLPSHLNNSMS